jgi:hypothetical protein
MAKVTIYDRACAADACDDAKPYKRMSAAKALKSVLRGNARARYHLAWRYFHVVKGGDAMGYDPVAKTTVDHAYDVVRAPEVYARDAEERRQVRQAVITQVREWGGGERLPHPEPEMTSPREALRALLKQGGLCGEVDVILDSSSSLKDAWKRATPNQKFRVAGVLGVEMRHTDRNPYLSLKCPVCFSTAGSEDLYLACLDAFKRKTGLGEVEDPRLETLRRKREASYSTKDWEEVWKLERELGLADVAPLTPPADSDLYDGRRLEFKDGPSQSPRWVRRTLHANVSRGDGKVYAWVVKDERGVITNTWGRPRRGAPRHSLPVPPRLMAFPDAIDNTIRSSAATCLTQAKYAYIEDLSGPGESVHLHYGACIAAGLEGARRAFFDEKLSHADAVEKGGTDRVRYVRGLRPAAPLPQDPVRGPGGRAVLFRDVADDLGCHPTSAFQRRAVGGGVEVQGAHPRPYPPRPWWADLLHRPLRRAWGPASVWQHDSGRQDRDPAWREVGESVDARLAGHWVHMGRATTRGDSMGADHGPRKARDCDLPGTGRLHEQVREAGLGLPEQETRAGGHRRGPGGIPPRSILRALPSHRQRHPMDCRKVAAAVEKGHRTPHIRL